MDPPYVRYLNIGHCGRRDLDPDMVLDNKLKSSNRAHSESCKNESEDGTANWRKFGHIEKKSRKSS
jgi:hypothetical protein